MKEAGYPNVPIVSLNLSGLESNPGFKITPKLVYQLVKACVWGDLLMTCLLATRPYEIHSGETNKLYDAWMKKLYDGILNGEKMPHKKLSQEIINDFANIKVNETSKPRVGVVGEILVKFHPGANNNIIDVIEREGGEAVMPGLLDFMLYCFYNSNFKHKHLGFSAKAAAVCNLGDRPARKISERYG